MTEAKPQPSPRRRQIVFLVLFVVILAGSFTLLSVNWVNDNVVVPFTAWVAWTSGHALRLLGQPVTLSGTVIRGPSFAVNIENGCNGVETVVIFVAAVLAFPARWTARLAGLVLGLVAIQVINLVRVVALYLTGAYLPSFFDTSHTVIWQTVVILSGLALFVLWASRVGAPESRGGSGGPGNDARQGSGAEP